MNTYNCRSHHNQKILVELAPVQEYIVLQYILTIYLYSNINATKLMHTYTYIKTFSRHLIGGEGGGVGYGNLLKIRWQGLSLYTPFLTQKQHTSNYNILLFCFLQNYIIFLDFLASISSSFQGSSGTSLQTANNINHEIYYFYILYTAITIIICNQKHRHYHGLRLKT